MLKVILFLMLTVLHLLLAKETAITNQILEQAAPTRATGTPKTILVEEPPWCKLKS